MVVQLLLSFDDSTPHNMRAASLLEKHGLKACFYLDTDGISVKMNENDVRSISKQHEIGSHTITHSNLQKLDPDTAAWEISESKYRLEQMLKRPVESFAYPYGRYDERLKKSVSEAGYSSGRTTRLFTIDVPEDVYEFGATLWADPHPYRKILSTSKILDLKRVVLEPSLIKDWSKFARIVLDPLIDADGGLFHIIVHADFIEERHEWARLDDLFEIFASRPNLHNLTIGEYISGIRKRNS